MYGPAKRLWVALRLWISLARSAAEQKLAPRRHERRRQVNLRRLYGPDDLCEEPMDYTPIGADLRAENERLREALRNFGVHAETCPSHRLFPECDCGLDAALSEKER